VEQGVVKGVGMLAEFVTDQCVKLPYCRSDVTLPAECAGLLNQVFDGLHQPRMFLLVLAQVVAEIR
jgi:hypothetical protein